MDQELGDVYLRRIATFIRANDKALAESGYVRRRRPQRRRTVSNTGSYFNLQGWFTSDAQPRSPVSPKKPITFTIDTHRLFYILMRLEALGFDIGTLDVRVDNPSKPMHYTHIDLGPNVDKSETLSLASFRSSLSAVSGLSLGVGWWGRAEPQSIDLELKFIYSSFTKLPALSIKAPGPKVIAELANDLPNQNALPLDVFKNLQTLECTDIDPRTLLGWDRLAESLRSLTIKRSGLEDVTDIFIGAVLDDQARRDGTSTDQRTRQIPRRQISFQGTPLPTSVPEDADKGIQVAEYPQVPSPGPALSPYKWGLLKHLSLADNALTFLPTDPLPHLVSVTHLDLSSNLFVSVPHGLAVLHNLVSLNLSDNMIDTVLGIYTHLGQVLSLNLSGNRLESICGLERLMALERVDLRSNHIEESAEVGRLATLPNITDVWIEGNPVTEIEDNYRVACFDLFSREGKSISLDGSSPGFYERRGLTSAPPEQVVPTRPVATSSPPVVAVGPARSKAVTSSPAIDSPLAPQLSPSSSGSRTASPMLTAAVAGRSRKRKVKRIVELDGDGGQDAFVSTQLDSSRPDAQPLNVRQRSPPRTHRSSSTSPRKTNPLSHTSHQRSYTMFEPADTSSEGQGPSQIREAELYRARIEALRSDMGEGWLRVFSQSQVSSPAAG
ncbi:leucine rich repeat domain-containing protein [Phlebopus sp. FC_14]|nr:leucine rich repeat domain-containing protein [Phlebopus sp. FC_14]